MKEKESIFRYYDLDTHTNVLINGDLTEEEKKKFGIDENHSAIFNEIGFSTPKNNNAWEKDCFNILVSVDGTFDEVDVILLDISELPQRLEATYKDIIEKRNNSF
jgi:hypothetical protein